MNECHTLMIVKQEKVSGKFLERSIQEKSVSS